MKARMLVSLVVMAGACGSVAMGQASQNVAPVPATPATTAPAAASDARPILTFEGIEKDFGRISDDRPVYHEFKFTNTGNADLTITGTRGSCGCTVPALPKTTFKPGEGDVIRVTYNPHGRRGPQHTTVTVTSNDPSASQAVLTLKSIVSPMIAVDPTIINLGEIERTAATVRTVMVTSRDPSLKPEGLQNISERLSAVIGQPVQTTVEGEAVTQYPIELSFRPDQALGPIQEVVNFRTNRQDRVLTVTMTGEVVGQVKATPARVSFGALTPAQGVRSELRLTSRTGESFTIEKVEQAVVAGAAGSLNFEVIKEQESPLQYIIRVTGAAPEQPGQMRGDIVITTNLDKDRTIRVPYFAFIRGGGNTQRLQPINQPSSISPWDTNPSSLVPPGQQQRPAPTRP